MSLSEFIDSIQNTVAKDAITEAELGEMYQSIRGDPFTFKDSEGEEVLAMTAPSMKGPLEKLGSAALSKWVEHFFVLSNSCMYYFSPESRSMVDPDPLGVIQLVSVEVHPVEKTQIKVVASEGALQYVKFRPGKPPRYVAGRQWVLFRAQSHQLRDKWLYRMKTSIGAFQLGGIAFGEAPDPHPAPADDDFPYDWGGRARRGRPARPPPAAARMKRASTVRGGPIGLNQDAAPPAEAVPLKIRTGIPVPIRPPSQRRTSLSDDGFDPYVPPPRPPSEIGDGARPPRRVMFVHDEPKPAEVLDDRLVMPTKEKPARPEGEKPVVTEEAATPTPGAVSEAAVQPVAEGDAVTPGASGSDAESSNGTATLTGASGEGSGGYSDSGSS